jgi:hypothetical protein
MVFPRNSHAIVWFQIYSQFCKKPIALLKSFFSLLIGFFLSLSTAHALEFAPQVSYELSSTSPTDIVVANLDPNNDNFPDLAVAMSGIGGGDGTVSFLFSDGTGVFNGTNLPDGIFNIWGIDAGDFDGDLIPDLAVTIFVTPTGSASQEVRILKGDGLGGFSTLSSSLAPLDSPRSVAHGDFDEDGIPDLAVGMDTGVAIHLGIPSATQESTGTFEDGILVANSGSMSGRQVVVGYINSDTHLDIVTPQAVYIGAGDGTFTRPTFFTAFAAVALGYLNNDNLIDVALAGGSTVRVYHGNGDGTFQFGYDQAVGVDLSDIVIVDLNQDLISDIVVTDKGDTIDNDSVFVLLGTTSGTSSTPLSFAVGNEPTQVVVGDWNQDSWLDIAASYANQGEQPSVSVLIQQPPVVSSPGVIHFSDISYSALENVGTATMTVVRTGGSLGEIQVPFTIGGTATLNTDYTLSPASPLTFADGSTASQEITVTISNDSEFELPDETVEVALGQPTGGATLGVQSASVLTILNDDPTPPAGEIAFALATASISEAASPNTITLEVIRTGGSFGTVQVPFTIAGTATLNTDYTVSPANTLSFADGTTASQFITVTVNNDTDFEVPDETVEFTLGIPSGGATLGAQITNVLTIVGGVNKAPIGVADVYSISANTTLSVAAPGVLQNDTDAEGDALSAVLVNGTNNGLLNFNTDGSFNYTPEDGAVSDNFTYVANDGNLDSVLTIVNINIIGGGSPNDLPMAYNDWLTTTINVPITFSVTANDTDVDGTIDVASVVIVQPPIKGKAVNNVDGTVTYTPEPDFRGSEFFIYTVNDNDGATSNSAWVQIIVR